MTHAFCGEAERNGATIRVGERVEGDLPGYDVVVNCAGLHADEVARGFGDDSFAIQARKGEFGRLPEPGSLRDPAAAADAADQGDPRLPTVSGPCLLWADGR